MIGTTSAKSAERSVFQVRVGHFVVRISHEILQFSLGEIPPLVGNSWLKVWRCVTTPCVELDDVVDGQEDIVAVNQIFKDLGMLVHEQADIIG